MKCLSSSAALLATSFWPAGRSSPLSSASVTASNASTSLCCGLKVRFSATLGEEPEVEMTLV